MRTFRPASPAVYLAPIAAAALCLLLVVFLPPGAAPGAPGAGAAQTTGECSGAITPATTEGPYWKAGSPERASLVEPGMSGTRVVLTGFVFDRECRPIPRAWLDFWQTDAAGAYDNAGYRMRGHIFADQLGRYRVETVIPGEYPGRTAHIHVKVQSPGGPVLTTQLYFPGVARNNSDRIFDEALLVRMEDTPAGKVASYNFVLNVTLPQTAPGAGQGYRFPETGFTVTGDFWAAWQGGRSFEDSLYINGLPIGEARDEVSPTDGKVYRTQWFERARFEYHPENAAPYRVLLGLLGVAAARGREDEAPFRPIANPGGLLWFPETRHTVGDNSAGGRAIAAFWASAGGLQQFGYPLSQPFAEVSKDDGKSYLVQYFERQRLEYHPENRGTRYEVLLGRLGVEQVK